MYTMDERRVMIGKIANLPAQLRTAVQGLAGEQLQTPYGPGKWTISQVVHHLADSHMNAFIRFKLGVTEDTPTIKPYSQDAWANQIEAKGDDLGHSLAILDGLHARWVVLMNSLPEAAWSRKLNHPETGSLTLDDILRIYSKHGEKHIGHIMGLRTARNW